jgi:hypothetical protein
LKDLNDSDSSLDIANDMADRYSKPAAVPTELVAAGAGDKEEGRLVSEADGSGSDSASFGLEEENQNG